MYKQIGQTALASIAMVLGLVFIPTVVAQTNDGVVQGVVQDEAGRGVTGAFVKLKNAERRLTFMVISQAEGRYRADRLPPGEYTAQGIGDGFESAWSQPTEVRSGRASQIDLSLTTRMGPMLAPAWPNRIAEDLAVDVTLPTGEGQSLVENRCGSCHGLEDVTKMRVDRPTWRMYLEQMAEEVRDRGLRTWTGDEADVMIDYLAAHFPPMPVPDPNSRLPRDLMEGATANYRVVHYDLMDGNAQTHDIAADPWGHGWANQRIGPIGHLDPDTLEFSEVLLPAEEGRRPRPGNVHVSADGKVWTSDGRRKLSYDIQAKEWRIYDYPEDLPGSPGGNTTVTAPNGIVWTSGFDGRIKSLNPETGEWKVYETPSIGESPGGYGIAVAGDGTVWMALDSGDRMTRLDPETGGITEVDIPVEGRIYPRRLGTDGEGNIWVGLWRAGKLLKIDPRTNETTVFDPPSGRLSGAYSVTVDTVNNLVWVSLQTVDKIARFNPETGEWAEFPLPEAQSDVRRIEVDPTNPNRIWWSTAGGTTNGTTGSAISGGSRMGFLEVLN